MINKLRLNAAIVAGSLATLAAAAPAAAQSYDFTFSSTEGSGSGVFTTTGMGNQLTVTGITGTIGGAAITGLSGYASADQQLFLTGASNFDEAGISFMSSTGVDYNFTNFPGGVNNITDTNINPPGTTAFPSAPLTFAVRAEGAVPEPATWAMMLLGFGMVGFGLRYSRKQSMRVTFA